MQKILIYSLFLLFGCFSFSQSINYSDNLTISVITCGPGEELYSKFGHSAFRIQDHTTHLDIVYNYGVFDFTAPNFYTNFAKGKLIYKLGRTRYDYFYEQYEYENREVKEQILNLTNTQEKKLAAFLEINAKPENTRYQYDFFYNNCATKIREVLDIVFPNLISYSNKHITTSYTLRELINNNVTYNTWANVGINIALGSVIDIKATTDEYQFLPKYIYEAFENARINNNSLVKENRLILNVDNSRVKKDFYSILSPLVIFTLLSIIIIYFTYKDYKKNNRNIVLDFVILLSTGAVGILILLLWFATNHTTTAGNLNILWAFAPNLIIAVLLLKKNKQNWLFYYFILLIVLLGIQAIVWMFKIEEFVYTMIPIFIALGIRYTYLMKYFK